MLPSSHADMKSGWVVWITGLPSAGKSMLAGRLRERLVEGGTSCCVLDGDAVRAALIPPPSYTPEGRDAFYATLARLAALLASQGLVVVVPATAHKRLYRAEARALAPRYLEVYVETAAPECARRDAKGLYAATREGRAAGMPGADVGYEAPESPDVVATGGLDEHALMRVVAWVAGNGRVVRVPKR